MVLAIAAVATAAVPIGASGLEAPASAQAASEGGSSAEIPTSGDAQVPPEGEDETGVGQGAGNAPPEEGGMQDTPSGGASNMDPGEAGAASAAARAAEAGGLSLLGGEAAPLEAPAGPNVVDVSTWADFKAALNNASVTGISIRADLSSDSAAAAAAHNDVPIAGATRNLVIDGNGFTVNFKRSHLVPAAGSTGTIEFADITVSQINEANSATTQGGIFNLRNAGTWALIVNGVTMTGGSTFAYASGFGALTGQNGEFADARQWHNNSDRILDLVFRGTNSFKGTAAEPQDPGTGNTNRPYAVFKEFRNVTMEAGSTTTFDTAYAAMSSEWGTGATYGNQLWTVQGGAALNVTMGNTFGGTDDNAAGSRAFECAVNYAGRNKVEFVIEAGGTVDITDKSAHRYAELGNMPAPLRITGDTRDTSGAGADGKYLKVSGTLRIDSWNANGISFGHATAGYKSLVCDGGTVDVLCRNVDNSYYNLNKTRDNYTNEVGGQYGAAGEYAGIDLYTGPGHYARKELRVKNGGSVKVDSLGARGVAVAGGEAWIEVDGSAADGTPSSLWAYGAYWAFTSDAPDAGSQRSGAYIDVTNGGQLTMESDFESAFYMHKDTFTLNVDGYVNNNGVPAGTFTPSSFTGRSHGMYGGLDIEPGASGSQWAINVKNGAKMDIMADWSRGGAALGAAVGFGRATPLRPSDTVGVNVSGKAKDADGAWHYSTLRAEAGGAGSPVLAFNGAPDAALNIGKDSVVILRSQEEQEPAIYLGTGTDAEVNISGAKAYDITPWQDGPGADYGRLYDERPDPYVSIDMTPPATQDGLGAHFDREGHARTGAMTAPSDQSPVIMGTAYGPSYVSEGTDIPVGDGAAVVKVYIDDGTLVTNGDGYITGGGVLLGTTKATDGWGKWSIALDSPLPAGTKLVAQASIGAAGEDGFLCSPSTTSTESQAVVWNKNQPLLIDAEDAGAGPQATSQADKLAVYKRTQADGSIKLSFSGVSAARVGTYASAGANPATVYVEDARGHALGSFALGDLASGKNAFDIVLTPEQTATLTPGSTLKIRVIDDGNTFEPQPGGDLPAQHITDWAYAEVKAIEPSVTLSQAYVNTTASGEGRATNKVGDVLHYTVTVTNSKPDSLYTGVLASDALPPGLELVPGTVKANSSLVYDNLTDVALGDASTLGDVAGAKSLTLEFDATITAGWGTTLTNSASASGTYMKGDNTSGTKSASGDDGGVYVEKMNPVKYVSAAAANITSKDGKNRVGDKLRYTITIKNNAAQASTWAGVVLTDELAAGQALAGTLASVKIDGAAAGAAASFGTGSPAERRTLYVALGDIESGDTKTVTFEVAIDASASGRAITNAAVADGEEGEPVSTGAEEVPPEKHFTKAHRNLTAEGDGARADTRVGDVIEYTLTLWNGSAGKSTWEVESVTDDLTLGGQDWFDLSATLTSLRVDYDDAGAPAAVPGAALTNGALTVPVDDLKVGGGPGAHAKAVITFEVVVKANAAGASIVNVGKTADGTQAEDGGGTGFEVGKEPPAPHITGSHVNETAVAEGRAAEWNAAGDVVAFTLTVWNSQTAASTWENVIVTDPLNSAAFDLTDKAATLATVKIDGTAAGDRASFADDTLIVDIGSLDSGGTKAITFTLVMTAGAEGQLLWNVAYAKQDNDDGKVTATSNADWIPAAAPPVKSFTISHTNVTAADAGRSEAKVGDTIRYTLTLENTSSYASTWELAEVMDDLTAGGHDYFDTSGTLDSLAVAYYEDGVLDSGYTPAADPAGAALSPTGLLTVPLDDLSKGPGGHEKAVVTFTAVLKSGAAGAAIVSAGRADDGTTATDGGGFTVEKVDPVKSVSQSYVNKTAQEAWPPRVTNKAGDTLVYTITVSNNATAPSLWEDVVVRDALPAGLTITDTLGSVKIDGMAAAASPGGGVGEGEASYGSGSDAEERTLYVNVGDIESGATVAVSFEAVISGSAAGQAITNTATAGGEDGTAPGTNVDEDQPVGNFAMAHTNLTDAARGAGDRDKGKTVIGDVLKYTLTLENTSTNRSTWHIGSIRGDLTFGGAGYFDLTDTLGSVKVRYGTAVAATVPGATLNAGQLEVPVDDLKVNGGDGTYSKAVVTFEVKVKGAAAGVSDIRNVASLSDDQAAAADSGVSVEKAAPVPVITKAVENLTAEQSDPARATNLVGDQIRYTVRVKNDQADASTWEGVVMTDMLPAGLDLMGTLASVRIDGSAVPAGTGVGQAAFGTGADARKLSVNLGDIANGVTRTVTFVVTVTGAAAGLTVRNVAAADGGNAGPVQTDPVDLPTDEGEPVKVFAKSHTNLTSEDGKYRVGDRILYTLHIENAQIIKSTWESITITDNLLLNGRTVFGTAVTADPIWGGTVNSVKVFYDGAATATPVTGVGLANGVLSVPIGDLVVDGTSDTDPSTHCQADITFEVILLPAAAGENLQNVAVTSDGAEAMDGGTGGGYSVERVAPEKSVVTTVTNVTASAEDRAANRVGDTLTYTITASNTSEAASVWEDVVIDNELSTGFDIDGTLDTVKINGIAAGPAATLGTGPGARKLSVSVGDIHNGQTRTITFDVIINASAEGAVLENMAVAGDGAQGKSPDADTGEADPVKRFTKSHVNLTSRDGKNRIGDTIRYTLTLENQAATKSTWHIGSVVDTLTIGGNEYFDLSGTLASLKVAFGNSNGAVMGSPGTEPLAALDLAPASPTYGLLTLPVGDLTVDGISDTNPTTHSKVVITFEAVIKETAAGVNVVNVAGLTDDPAKGTDPGVQVEKADPVPQVTKAAENLTTTSGLANNPGDQIRYTVRVKNNATAASTWTDVVLTDVLPDGLTITGTLATVAVDGAPAGAAASFGTDPDERKLTVALGDIGSGVEKVVTFEAVLAAADLEIENAATATGGNAAKASDPIDLPVEEEDPVKVFTKTHVNKTAALDGGRTNTKAGDTIEYTLHAGNANLDISTWENVRITDNLNIGGRQVFDTSGTLASLKVKYYWNDGTTTTASYPAAGAKLADGLLTVPGNGYFELCNGGPYERSPASYDAVDITFEVVVLPAAAGGKLVNVAETTDGSQARDDNNATPNEQGDDGYPVDKAAPIPQVVQSFANKTAEAEGRASSKAGDTLVYTVTVANTQSASSTWADVVMRDALPAGLVLTDTLGSVRVGGAAPEAGRAYYGTGSVAEERTLYVELGDIGSGDASTVTFEAVVAGPLAGTTIRNTASANGTDGSAAPSGDDVDPPVKVFTITHENTTDSARAPGDADKGRTVVGDTIRYTLTLENQAEGQSTWAVGYVTDDLSVGGNEWFDLSATQDSIRLYYDGSAEAEAFAPGDIGVSAGGHLLVKVGGLVVDGAAQDPDTHHKAVITFDVKVKLAAAGASIVNVAGLTGDARVKGTDSGFTVGKADPVPHVAKAVSNKTAAAEDPARTDSRVGDTLLYSITVSNDQTAASNWKNVLVSDPLHEALTITDVLSTVKVDGSAVAEGDAYFGTAAGDARTLYVKAGDIANGQSKVVTFEAVLSEKAAGATVTNTASAGPEQGSPPAGAEEAPPVKSLAKAHVNLTDQARANSDVDKGKTVIGDIIRYTLTAENKAAAQSTWDIASIVDDLSVGGKDVFETAADDGWGGTLASVQVAYGNGAALETPHAAAAETEADLTGGLLTLYVDDLVAHGGTGDYAKVVITFEVKVKPAAAGQTIANKAHTAPDGIEAEDPGVKVEKAAPVPHIAKAHLNLTNTGSVPPANRENDTIRFSLTVWNSATAASTWEDVVVTDVLRDSVYIGAFDHSQTLETLRIDGKAPEPGQVYFDIWDTDKLVVRLGGIDSGVTRVITFDVQLTGEAAGNTIHSKAYAKEGDDDSKVKAESNDEAIPSGALQPIKSFTKSHFNVTADAEGRANTKPGDEIEYTLTLENTQTGKSTWDAGAIMDDLTLGGHDWFDLSATLASVTIQYDGTGAPMAVPGADLTGGVLAVPIDPDNAEAGNRGKLITGGPGDTDPGTHHKAVIKYRVVLKAASAGQTVQGVARAVDGTTAADGNGTEGTEDDGIPVDKADPVKALNMSGADAAPGRGADGETPGERVQDIAVTTDGLTVAASAAGVIAGVKGPVKRIEQSHGSAPEADGPAGIPDDEADPVPAVTESVANVTAPARYLSNGASDPGDLENLVGDTIRYTVVVRNNAAAAGTWAGVSITDDLHAALTTTGTLASVKVDGAPVAAGDKSLTGGTLMVRLGDIANGQQKVVTFEAVLGPEAPGTHIGNVAVADGGNAGPVKTPEAGLPAEEPPEIGGQ